MNDIGDDTGDDMNDVDGPADSAPAAPVDTLREPHEPHVERPSTAKMWVVVLAGPVLVMLHFWFVYLVAEASCEADRAASMTFVGPDALTGIVLAATVVGVVAALVAAWAARRSIGSALSRAGVVMSIGSAATIMAVGLPILALSPC